MSDPPAARPGLPRWKKALFTLLIVLFTLPVGEVALRLAGLKPAVNSGPQPPDAFAYYIVCDRHLGFRNRPNGRYQAWQFPAEPLSTTDDSGYRNGVGWDPQGAAPAVIFVGDSMTFGSEVNDDETGPSEVAKRLGGECNVRVLNAGVRGYSALQVKRMLGECLQRFPGARAAVYTHYVNDLEESMIPCIHYPAKAPVMARDDASGELREKEVTRPAVPWGASFLSWHPAVPPPPPGPWTRCLTWCRAHSALVHHGAAELERWAGERPMFPRPEEGDPPGLPSDPAQWHRWAREHDGDAVMVRILTDMNRLCAEHGVPLVATSYYCGLDADAPAEFAAWCKAAGVRYVSLVGHFPDSPASYTAWRADGRYDPHYSHHGTETYAEALAPVLRDLLRSHDAEARRRP